MMNDAFLKPSSSLTMGSLLRLLAPKRRGKKTKSLCNWPPDAFAVAGYLLHSTGLYRKAVCNRWWKSFDQSHPERLELLGAEWRKSASAGKSAPREVHRLWATVLQSHRLRITQLISECQRAIHRPFITALFDLVAAADEASQGMGLPHADMDRTDATYRLYEKADELSMRGSLFGEASTLCEYIDTEVVCVLPKMHTPQVGLTFRSLSHHLALCPRNEVAPVWNRAFSTMTTEATAQFNLLLVPYPFNVEKKQFKAHNSENRCGRHHLPDSFRNFTYEVKDNLHWLRTEFPKILAAAVKKAPEARLDGVVFPELSLSGEAELIEAYKQIAEVSPTAILVAGVHETSRAARRDSHYNTAQFVIPAGENEVFICKQKKHHRWRMDQGQINDYGLHKQLATGRSWWEQISVGERELNFFALKRWFTFCLLVCEDLARQEPASRIVRAVAPSLLIALLLDGPQIKQRWPGRYVTVLGEDPGIAVLTLTSRGMVQLSNEQRNDGKKAPIIALWRDPKNFHEIPLASEARAVLLSLRNETISEHSADGRENSKASALLLPEAGIQQISLPEINP